MAWTPLRSRVDTERGKRSVVLVGFPGVQALDLGGPSRAVPARTGADCERVKRWVVLVGFQGVQALDLVGPFEVFTGATLCLEGQGRHDDGYEVTIASVEGRPVATGTGLEIVATP